MSQAILAESWQELKALQGHQSWNQHHKNQGNSGLRGNIVHTSTSMELLRIPTFTYKTFRYFANNVQKYRLLYFVLLDIVFKMLLFHL